MPTIEFDLKDMEKMIGRNLPEDEDKLNDIFQHVKGEVENIENNTITLALADGTRPELWSVEGIARELKGELGVETGLKEYVAKSSDYKIFVNPRLEKIRGFIACAVVKNLKLDDYIIKQLMQTQEKIDMTFGRNRKKTSIGLYNLEKLKWPLKYTLTKPDENSFVPLGFMEKLTPKQILEKHPKGEEYGMLLKGLNEYPIFVDEEGKVLSIPPVINSNDLGQVNENSKDILIEITGTDYSAVNQVLTIISTALADRGGEIYRVTIDYSHRKIDITPHFETKTVKLSLKEINDWLGTKLDALDVTKALQKARYNVNKETDSLMIKIPCYRNDIMHDVDIIEDIAIMHGYAKIEPKFIDLPTTGKLLELEKFSNKIRELGIGLGAQEILTFTLTDKETLFKKMNLKESPVIEISNPVSLNYYVLRNSLMPMALDFLSKNTTREFPQKIFEEGEVTDQKETRKKFCLAIAHNNANFTDIKQAIESISSNLGLHFTLKEKEHESFIIGRCASIMFNNIEVGILGEVHPLVLINFRIEVPVAMFEIDIQKLQ